MKVLYIRNLKLNELEKDVNEKLAALEKEGQVIQRCKLLMGAPCVTEILSATPSIEVPGRVARSVVADLESVLCDPEGKVCVVGSEEDRAIITRALEALKGCEY